MDAGLRDNDDNDDEIDIVRGEGVGGGEGARGSDNIVTAATTMPRFNMAIGRHGGEPRTSIGVQAHLPPLR